jgi:hypothetical protein
MNDTLAYALLSDYVYARGAVLTSGNGNNQPLTPVELGIPNATQVGDAWVDAASGFYAEAWSIVMGANSNLSGVLLAAAVARVTRDQMKLQVAAAEICQLASDQPFSGAMMRCRNANRIVEGRNR